VKITFIVNKDRNMCYGIQNRRPKKLKRKHSNLHVLIACENCRHSDIKPLHDRVSRCEWYSLKKTCCRGEAV